MELRVKETEECLLATAAGVSVMLFLLSVIVLCVCVHSCACVCVCAKQVIEAGSLVCLPVLIKMKETQMWMRDYLI